MVKMTNNNRGWYNESKRHSLARRGIKTDSKLRTHYRTIDFNDDGSPYESNDYDSFFKYIETKRIQTPDRMYHMTSKENLKKILENGFIMQEIDSDDNFIGRPNGTYFAGTMTGAVSATAHREPDSVMLEVDTRDIEMKMDPMYFYFFDGCGNIYSKEEIDVRIKEILDSPNAMWTYTREPINKDRIIKIYTWDELPRHVQTVG